MKSNKNVFKPLATHNTIHSHILCTKQKELSRFQKKAIYLDKQSIYKKSTSVVSNTNYSNYMWSSECLGFYGIWWQYWKLGMTFAI